MWYRSRAIFQCSVRTTPACFSSGSKKMTTRDIWKAKKEIPKESRTLALGWISWMMGTSGAFVVGSVPVVSSTS